MDDNSLLLKALRQANQAQRNDVDGIHAHLDALADSIHGHVESIRPPIGWVSAIALAAALNIALPYAADRWPVVSEFRSRLEAVEDVGIDALFIRSLPDSAYRAPLAGKLIVTSPYGERIHPMSGERSFHEGVDYACHTGDSVMAARAGVVDRTGYQANGAGNYVVIRHRDGAESKYMHLDRVTISQGAEVAAWQPIGDCGVTGDATGPHLHVELINAQGEHVDPAPLIRERDYTTVYNRLTPEQLGALTLNIAATEGDYPTISWRGYLGRYQFGGEMLTRLGHIKPSAFHQLDPLSKVGVCVIQGTAYQNKPANFEQCAHRRFLLNPANWTLAGGANTFLASKTTQDQAFLDMLENHLADAKRAQALNADTPAYKVGGFLKAAQFGVRKAIRWYRLGVDSHDGNGKRTSTYARQGEEAVREARPNDARFAPLASDSDTTFSGVRPLDEVDWLSLGNRLLEAALGGNGDD